MRIICALCSWLVMTTPLLAHHSFVVDFDNDDVVQIHGVVTRLLPVNPHPRIWVDVTGSDGETSTWELQGRRGDGDVEIGATVTVEGFMHRRQARSLYVTSITTAAGSAIENPDLDPGEERRGIEPNPRFRTHTAVAAAHGSNQYPVDITGDWNQRYRGLISIDDLQPQPIPFAAAGRRLYAENQQFGKDPALRCINTGLARLFSGPSRMKIYDVGPFYLFLYALGQRTHRTIYMDGRGPPEDQPLTFMGFSTGRWENRRLVIETTHLKPMWLDVTGLPSSGAETRVVETYELAEDGLTMERTMTFHDPLYAAPLTRTRYSSRDTESPLGDRDCEPDGFYRDLVTEGLIDEHLGVEDAGGAE